MNKQLQEHQSQAVLESENATRSSDDLLPQSRVIRETKAEMMDQV